MDTIVHFLHRNGPVAWVWILLGLGSLIVGAWLRRRQVRAGPLWLVGPSLLIASSALLLGRYSRDTLGWTHDCFSTPDVLDRAWSIGVYLGSVRTTAIAGVLSLLPALAWTRGPTRRAVAWFAAALGLGACAAHLESSLWMAIRDTPRPWLVDLVGAEAEWRATWATAALAGLGGLVVALPELRGAHPRARWTRCIGGSLALGLASVCAWGGHHLVRLQDSLHDLPELADVLDRQEILSLGGGTHRHLPLAIDLEQDQSADLQGWNPDRLFLGGPVLKRQGLLFTPAPGTPATDLLGPFDWGEPYVSYLLVERPLARPLDERWRFVGLRVIPFRPVRSAEDLAFDEGEREVRRERGGYEFRRLHEWHRVARHYEGVTWLRGREPDFDSLMVRVTPGMTVDDVVDLCRGGAVCVVVPEDLDLADRS